LILKLLLDYAASVLQLSLPFDYGGLSPARVFSCTSLPRFPIHNLQAIYFFSTRMKWNKTKEKLFVCLKFIWESCIYWNNMNNQPNWSDKPN
jgi:hypothetical protein